MVHNYFPGNTATHSLRKGGARFYAAAEAPEQATRDQGGWRTTETMKEIYTSLTPSEVKTVLHNAANTAGDSFAVQTMVEQITAAGPSTEFGDNKVAIDFASLVVASINNIPWKTLTELKVGVHFKSLVRHPNDEVRSKATSSLCLLRSARAAYMAKNRKE